MHRPFAVVAGAAALSFSAFAPAGVQATGDFNNDGFADLAIGVPGEDIAGQNDAGAVHIIYGSSARLSADQALGNQFLHEGLEPFPGAPGKNDQFGAAVAAGDFNGDGFDDLAIGVPGREVANQEHAGAVFVLYGSASGIDVATVQVWHQNKPDVRSSCAENDAFGTALASGDLNDDGFDDLAIGAPNKSVGSVIQAGGVAVLLGSVSGITATGNLYITQDSASIADAAEIADHFGKTLAMGDFNGDGKADLVVGSPDEALDGGYRSGAVHVIYGDTDGLDNTTCQLWSQDNTGIGNRSESGDAFGAALAAGDFNDDGFDDLAIGVPGEDTSEVLDCGLVHVLYGRAGGLKLTGNQVWQQNNSSVPDGRQRGDAFGSALASGYIDADGFADLVVGVPGEKIGNRDGCGAINVFFGGGSGLAASGGEFWHQNSDGITDVSEKDDAFGSSLAMGDFDANGHDDVACGVPGEDVGVDGTATVIDNAGAVHVLYGVNAGLSSVPDQLWTEETPGIRGGAKKNDSMGGVAP